MHRYANPSRVMRLSRLLQPWLAGATVILIAAGLYLALVASPPDYQQGESVRIMYVHVPAAWMAMFCYAFTFLALVTGSLWGKPMWGTWWVWDARLTSVLILFFLYLGYMALQSAFDDPARGAKAAAIMAIVGFVNVPI
ncbi:MAG: cytochrome c biogenesis protein CcsA, partial [Rhodospirillales bacterium]|nr:cytochrome c biogenesis protein CcsA [Rhodospirillales bacterium]